MTVLTRTQGGGRTTRRSVSSLGILLGGAAAGVIFLCGVVVGFYGLGQREDGPFLGRWVGPVTADRTWGFVLGETKKTTFVAAGHVLDGWGLYELQPVVTKESVIKTFGMDVRSPQPVAAVGAETFVRWMCWEIDGARGGGPRVRIRLEIDGDKVIVYDVLQAGSYENTEWPPNGPRSIRSGQCAADAYANLLKLSASPSYSNMTLRADSEWQIIRTSAAAYRLLADWDEWRIDIDAIVFYGSIILVFEDGHLVRIQRVKRDYRLES